MKRKAILQKAVFLMANEPFIFALCNTLLQLKRYPWIDRVADRIRPRHSDVPRDVTKKPPARSDVAWSACADVPATVV